MFTHRKTYTHSTQQQLTANVALACTKGNRGRKRCAHESDGAPEVWGISLAYLCEEWLTDGNVAAPGLPICPHNCLFLLSLGLLCSNSSLPLTTTSPPLPCYCASVYKHLIRIMLQYWYYLRLAH